MATHAQSSAFRRGYTFALLVLATLSLAPAAAVAQIDRDLRVSDITFSPAPIPGTQTVATARLTNAGRFWSGPFNIKWFLDGVQVGYGQHSSLGPGATSTDNVYFTWNVTPGDHILRYDADVDQHVAEDSEVNNSYQVRVVNGQVIPLADLYASSMGRGTPRVGEETVITAGLRNIGDTGSGGFNIKWFVDGAQMGYGSQSSLAAGEVRDVDFYWTPAAPGDHLVRFEADVDGHVLESNETNNAFQLSVAVLQALPDLVVDAISFSSPPTLGEETVATARLRNGGQTASGEFNVKWFLDGAQVGYGRHISLAPGETSSDNVHFTFTPTPGTHTLRFVADADGEVNEADETNNAVQASFTTRLPDLVVDAITFSAPPTLGQETTATAQLRNLGQAVSGGFNIRWVLDGVEAGRGSHRSLAPGETSDDNVYFTFTATSGTHTLRYEADVDGHVPESNEGNNGFTTTFATRQADLLVDAITFSSSPALGETTTATARLRNAGQLASGEFNVRWLLDGVQVGAGRHVSLDPGQVSGDNVRFTFTPTAGTHTLRFEADYSGEVPESNEANNGFQTIFTTRQADLLADAISFSTPPFVGQQTVATARLRNVGNADSGPFNVRWLVDGTQLGYGSHVSLPPGPFSTDNVHLSWSPTSPGLHRVRFEADVDANVQELVETNNAVEVEVKVGPLPDLVVEDVTLATPPISGIPNVATARLRNAGPAGSSAFDVRWFVDGLLAGAGRHAPLASGAVSTDNVRLDWTPPSAGPHVLRFEADFDDQVVEVDDANNAFQRSFEVAVNPVQVGLSPSGPLSLTADGWYTPADRELLTTLTCPAGGPVCFAPLDITIGSPDGRARFYVQDIVADDRILCGLATEGSKFSFRSLTVNCFDEQMTGIVIPAGASRSVRFKVRIQPSDATTLRVGGTWGSYSSAQVSLAVPKAAVHPLVFIHGILGAMPPQNLLVTSRDQASIFDPFIGSYYPLLESLQKMGYEWNTTLFGLAYDWRNSNRLSGGFLGRSLAGTVIPNARAVPYVVKDGKADLVVHSMGGLVSRSYIQGEGVDPQSLDPVPYGYDVNKVVFIASPHRGFPIDYRTREGMTWSDYLYNAPVVSGWMAMTVAMDGILWPGLVEKKYRPSDDELYRDCVWVPGGTVPGLVPYFLYFPGLRDGVLGVYQCTIEDITPWAQDHARGAESLFEMLPTEDMAKYLVSGGQPFPYSHEENTFLGSLNAGVSLLVDRVGADRIYVIYGDGAPETDAWYEVGRPGAKSWRYGAATAGTARETTAGDDLIPSFSTSLDGLVSLPPGHEAKLDAGPAAPNRARHKEIMFHPEVLGDKVPRFLTGAPFAMTTSYFPPFVNVEKLLAVMAACPIDLLVTDKYERRLGFDPASGQVLREIPNAVYAGRGEPQMILIANAEPGDYRITATGLATGAYSIRADQVGARGPVPLALFTGETTPSEQDQHTLRVGANTPPGAVPDRYILKPGQTLAVGAPGVLANDVELDAQPLQAILVSGPAKGSLSLNPDGSFSYTPGPDFLATDTFTYKASDGEAESSAATVTLAGRAPEVTAGPDQAASEGQPVSFFGSVVDDFPAGSHTVVWNFGDGATANGLTATHAYADNGVYTATLTVTSPAQLAGKDTMLVTVSNVAPTVEAGPDVAAPQGQDVAFAGSFSDPGAADTHTISWDFGDLTGADGTLTPTHAYAVPGSYVASLLVRDDDGGEGSDSLTVTISNVAPTVEAGPDATVGPNEDLRFHGSFTDPGWLDTHTIAWDFGDGGIAADTLEPVHRYTAIGVYTVTLTVTDNHGGVGRDALTVRVVCPSVFVETFEPYGAGADPVGWVDYAVDKAHRRVVRKEGFRTVAGGGGVVYRGAEWRLSEYATAEALAWRDYEWTGRFRLPGSHQPGLGLLVYSDVASGRAYHLTYHWSFNKDGFRALEGEKTALEGRSASRFVPEAGLWYRFRVRVETAAGKTLLRARFWSEGKAEPTVWAIDAWDSRAPLGHGSIGLLSIMDGVAFDDLRVEALSNGSGISGDREGDAVCDERDNCPAAPNPDQSDADGDGSGDACDSCTAAFERQELCLDDGLDPRNDLSDYVVQLIGNVHHLPSDGACGSAGFYRLGREDGLVVETPSLPGRSLYRLQLQVRAKRAGDALEVRMADRTVLVPLAGEQSQNAWAWTAPVVVELPGGAHLATVKTKGSAPVDVEALRLEEVCAEDR